MKEEERKKRIRKRLLLSELTLILVGIFICGVVVLTILYGSLDKKYTRSLETIKRLEHRVSNMQFVAEDLMLLQKIEDILVKEAADKLTIPQHTAVSRVIYRFHKDYSVTLGLSYARILGMIKKESNFNPQAKSTMGALGIAQMMPNTFIDLLEECYGLRGLSAKERTKLAYTPEVNLTCGLTYLVRLQSGYMSVGEASVTDWKAALTRYNWSDKAVKALMTAKKKATPKASLDYANEVEKFMIQYLQWGEKNGS